MLKEKFVSVGGNMGEGMDTSGSKKMGGIWYLISDLNKYWSNDELFESNLEKEGNAEGKLMFDMSEFDGGHGKLWIDDKSDGEGIVDRSGSEDGQWLFEVTEI